MHDRVGSSRHRSTLRFSQAAWFCAETGRNTSGRADVRRALRGEFEAQLVAGIDPPLARGERDVEAVDLTRHEIVVTLEFRPWPDDRAVPVGPRLSTIQLRWLPSTAPWVIERCAAIRRDVVEVCEQYQVGVARAGVDGCRDRTRECRAVSQRRRCRSSAWIRVLPGLPTRACNCRHSRCAWSQHALLIEVPGRVAQGQPDTRPR